jgi:hypothetical protein
MYCPKSSLLSGIDIGISAFAVAREQGLEPAGQEEMYLKIISNTSPNTQLKAHVIERNIMPKSPC